MSRSVVLVAGIVAGPIFGAVFGPACSDTGQDHAQVTLLVAGTEVAEPLVATGGVPVSLERADLAFGPLYLCAGTSAGDLCNEARLEWLDSVVVDTLDADETRAGELSGVTGEVRSWMYDLGISSQLTRSEPFILDAAEELDGGSIVVEGQAEVDGQTIPFAATIPVQQSDVTELGVPVVRKSSSESFFRDVATEGSSLLVRFDASRWVQGMDFRAHVSEALCTEDGPALVCDGAVERTCDGESETSSRDCAELDQVCLRHAGCQPSLTITSDSQAYRSLKNALVSGELPVFTWYSKKR